jgi:hypothetical protein
VDALVEAGWLEPLGFYGWSTWVGRWRTAGNRQIVEAMKR